MFLCLISFVELRKIYYPDTKDPHAIVFEGPTNYESRTTSENEIDDDISELIDARFGKANNDPPRVVYKDVITFPSD